ncbi:MAG: cation-translocating P-type ATPase [Candidatus Bathyarchaeota archaeon]|nr:cation-translocating P-type ATPase [Candidatus Bathyarchaeota archaeon]
MTSVEKRAWHAEDIESVLESLGSSRGGIGEEEARERLERFGPNELREERRTTPFELFLGQFKSILVIILMISAIVSAFISVRQGEPFTDTYVILIIVVLNAVLGFVQEYRAEKAVEALKKMVAPQVLVMRGGRESSIDSKDLVPGDVVLLEAGSRIPSDSRLLEVANLQVDEAALTGESRPVTKSPGVLGEDAGVGDRRNMVFMGTVVTGGRAVAVVTETGMSTEFGKIAGMVQAVEQEEPPLKQKMERMGRQLGAISVILCVWVFLIGVFVHKFDLETMFMTAVSLAVSAIPEGLPAVLTITLALGVSKMARQKAIVRRLASVETLGSTTVICSDKTGTLTRNEMTVKRIESRGRIMDVTGAGYVPKGEFLLGDEGIDPLDDDLDLLLRIGYLNNDAHLQENNGTWVVFGDPTEGALTVAGAKAGLSDSLKDAYPRIGEFPFESARKMMSTIHGTPEGGKVAYVKGAPEVVLGRSVSIRENGSVRRLTEEDRDRIQSAVMGMAREALRVLAMSYKDLPADAGDFEMDEIESGLTYVGLMGMIDPPRDEVPPAIKMCNQSGIRSVMVTGDHRLTAVAIAKEIGMLEDDDSSSVLTGADLEDMNDDELDEVIEEVRVFARVSPEHKMRIAQSLKRNGHIVAMTGDGVNDAPALKAADIGVAMGIKGTDVTKEASDMVLEDDNFATIVRAVRGGRHIYDNVTKYLRLMLAANFDEFIEITVVTLLGLPLPFLPIHILWINLVTDGLPAVALSIDPPDPDLMQYPPRDPNEGLLSRFWRFILFAAIVDFISDFIPFLYTYATVHAQEMALHGIEKVAYDVASTQARTVAFTSIVFFEFLLAYQSRSETHHIFAMGLKGWTENKMLFISVVVSLAMQMAIIYVPALNTVFRVAPLTPFQLLLCFVGSLTAFLIMPGKLIPRRRYVTRRKN